MNPTYRVMEARRSNTFVPAAAFRLITGAKVCRPDVRGAKSLARRSSWSQFLAATMLSNLVAPHHRAFARVRRGLHNDVE
jgi:hypothetical protein